MNARKLCVSVILSCAALLALALDASAGHGQVHGHARDARAAARAANNRPCPLYKFPQTGTRGSCEIKYKKRYYSPPVGYRPQLIWPEVNRAYNWYPDYVEYWDNYVQEYTQWTRDNDFGNGGGAASGAGPSCR